MKNILSTLYQTPVFGLPNSDCGLQLAKNKGRALAYDYGVILGNRKSVSLLVAYSSPLKQQCPWVLTKGGDLVDVSSLDVSLLPTWVFLLI